MALARFGTDGIRGLANEELTTEVAMALGRASVRVLGADCFLLGRDTRRSGPMLSAAFAAGVAAEGADAIDLGVIPTPGVATLCAQRSLPGAVVSASHNPFFDNGIKIFGPGGLKLSEQVEAAIEAELEAILLDPEHGPARPVGAEVGQVLDDHDAAERYVEHLVDSIRPGALSGMRIVIDCANGAGSPFAERVLSLLGAEVIVLAASPDGININDGVGSTHPEGLCAAVREHGASIGLALDGDADRLVAVDHLGEVVPGDALIALFALDLKARRELADDAVVVTVMTNLGFHRAMESAGIAVREVGVGDRNVLHCLEDESLSLGGEQSGHVIFRQRSTTGDGLLTGLVLADLVGRSGEPLADLSSRVLTLYPQVLTSVRVSSTASLDDASALWERIAQRSDELGDQGRILVRASGTEPVVRVMVEADDAAVASAIAEELGALVEAEMGATGESESPVA